MLRQIWLPFILPYKDLRSTANGLILLSLLSYRGCLWNLESYQGILNFLNTKCLFPTSQESPSLNKSAYFGVCSVSTCYWWLHLAGTGKFRKVPRPPAGWLCVRRKYASRIAALSWFFASASQFSSLLEFAKIFLASQLYRYLCRHLECPLLSHLPYFFLFLSSPENETFLCREALPSATWQSILMMHFSSLVGL